MHKVCSRCKILLTETEFNWKYKDKRRSSYCKSCSRLYCRSHYKNNRLYYLEKAKLRNRIVKNSHIEFIAHYLQSHPCVDCGESDILVLEFDHRERDNKISEVGLIMKKRNSLEKLKEEIAKCDVRCANCHRRKTEKESNSWKLRYASVA